MRFGCILTPTFVPVKAEVTSSNTVGYQKITLQPGYNAIAAQFVPVGASAITDILDVTDCSVLPTIDIDTETGEGKARLQKWNGRGYDIYEWTGNGVATAWEWDGIDNKWMTIGCEAIATVSTDVGEGFWLWLDPTEVSDPITLTVKGEVLSDTTIAVSLNSGYNLISNPFDVSINIQDMSFSNLPTIDVDTETGEGRARLQRWNGRGYDIYEWTGDGVAAAWEWDGIDNKWMTIGCEAIAENVVIAPGEGFWLWLDPSYEGLSSNVSVTFSNPTK